MDDNEISQRVKNAMIYGTSHPEMYKSSNDEIKELSERIKELEAESLQYRTKSARIAELEAENAKLREALRFYENPTGDVPDFYSELDFGSRARAELGENKP